jgi:hypothetical protein
MWLLTYMPIPYSIFIQALRHIAISPSSAESGGNRSSKKGYAALNNITRVTIPAIAYSAVMVSIFLIPFAHTTHYIAGLFRSLQ